MTVVTWGGDRKRRRKCVGSFAPIVCTRRDDHWFGGNPQPWQFSSGFLKKLQVRRTKIYEKKTHCYTDIKKTPILEIKHSGRAAFSHEYVEGLMLLKEGDKLPSNPPFIGGSGGGVQQLALTLSLFEGKK